MMIPTTCLLVTLIIFIHGQSGVSHFATFRQATDSLKSDTPRSFPVGEGNDRLEIDEGSGIMGTMLNVGECTGEDEDFTISLPNPSGCYIFQTTGFNLEGYPNNTGYYVTYWCNYYIQFGGDVNGTVTVKEKDFQFQEPDRFGFWDDYVVIFGVNDEQHEDDNSDSDDQDSRINSVAYCGTITGDKIRNFYASKISIRLAADATVNSNGAEIVICID
ncbi:uncharacterized protein LOC131891382 [Tigriopus californicus]|uniref:uncharacterized protein LOC131891382 n=1 Tax=Tigriopus californicus TaxID=6832 RepID=UPI0027DA5C30|nr:uncharacterized protein LOC131891382 [Tigriopus californicus]